MITYAAIAMIAVPASGYLARWWQQALAAVVLGALLARRLAALVGVGRYGHCCPLRGVGAHQRMVPVALRMGGTGPGIPDLHHRARHGVPVLHGICVEQAGARGPDAGAGVHAAHSCWLKKQLLMAVFYAIYTPLPPMTALASMGQFSLEAAGARAVHGTVLEVCVHGQEPIAG